MATQNNLSAINVNLLTAKMLQSKLDGRLAIFKRWEGDRVILEMDRLGEKNFSIETINNGFGFILDNESLVKSFFWNTYGPQDLFGEEAILEASSEIYDKLSGRFPDLTNHSIFLILTAILTEINKKSGL